MVKCSSRVMNGGRGGYRGRTAAVDRVKKLNRRVREVERIMVMSVV